MSFDASVVVDRHVRWQLLSATEQAELLANFPIHPSVTPPAAGVFGEDVPARFEAWLDTAYMLRHVNDTLQDDPYS